MIKWLEDLTNVLESRLQPNPVHTPKRIKRLRAAAKIIEAADTAVWIMPKSYKDDDQQAAMQKLTNSVNELRELTQ